MGRQDLGLKRGRDFKGWTGGTEFKETELCVQFPEEKTVWYIQRSVGKASMAGVWKKARAIKRKLER